MEAKMKANADSKRDESMTQDTRRLLELARDWMKQGNTTVAFQLLNEALKLKDTEGDRLITGEISKEIGRVYMQKGQWDRAEDAYKQATSMFLEQGCLRGAAESVRNLANMKFQLGQFKDSSSLCEKAIDWATNSGDFQLRATILNTQGAIKSIEGRQKESIKIFRLCLSDFRRSGNKVRQGYILHNIGLAHLELGEYEESRAAFDEAMELAVESQDTNLVELCYLNKAKLFLRLGDIVAARSLLKAAQELLEILKSPSLAADLAIIEAGAFRLAGDPNKAAAVLDDALEAARKHNLLQNEAELLCESGQIAMDQGHSEVARARLEAAISLFKKTGSFQIKKAVDKLRNLEASVKNAARV